MKIRTDYQGATLTDKYLTIHFRLEVGGTMVRSSMVKIKLQDIPAQLMLEAIDKTTRRKLLEIWSDQEILPFDD